MSQAISLALMSAITIGANFVFQVVLLGALGPGRETDAFFASLAVPQLIIVLVTVTAMQVLVPLLAGAGEAELDEQAWTFVLVVAGGVSALGGVAALAAPSWAPLVAPGLGAAARPVLVALTRVQLAAMVLGALATMLAAVCHARRRFLRVELGLALGTLTSLALLPWALGRWGVLAAAWLMVLRMSVYAGFLAPALGPLRAIAWRGEAVATAWRRLRPILLGGTLFRTDQLVDRILSSLAPAGGLSLLAFAQQVCAAGEQVLQKALVAPLVPQLAGHAAAGRDAEFFLAVRRRLPWCLALTVLPYLLLLALGRPALGLLAGHGIDSADVTLLWWLLVALGGVLIGGVLGQLASAAFFARGDTVTPMRVGVVTYLVYLPVKVLAFLGAGLLGLPIAASLWVLAGSALLLRALAKGRRHAAG
ncbi:MAG: lipid II flippase MurJ [Acidobacteriota bacterium]